MRDGRSTNKRAKRARDIKMEKTLAEKEPWGTPYVRGDEGEMYGWMATAYVRDERYEVNHYSES